ncbi:MAG: cyanoexosortase A system-associated protein [Hapalosiphonaceae cyanobacterium JJU2]|nr:MAG: cyanoexosortase A system-associated protein [Hapalosiphonaceae cyanobacterium JJU2]
MKLKIIILGYHNQIMITWKNFRFLLLILGCSNVLLVLGQVLFLPIPSKNPTDVLIFPEAPPLSQWQLKSTKAFPHDIQDDSELLAQKNYQYMRQGLPLDIEMRYVKTGDVNQLIRKYTKISSSALVRKKEDIGYYGLGIEQQKAYLSACINLHGNSTFTNTQFKQNQRQIEQPWQRLLPWLLGREQLRENNHCLWAHLSVPLNNSSPQATYQILETAWFYWYKYWHYNLHKY